MLDRMVHSALSHRRMRQWPPGGECSTIPIHRPPHFRTLPRVKRQKSSSYPGRFKTSRTGDALSLDYVGIEANRVVGLRVMKLMLGGKRARREARLMVTEKIHAGLEANARLMAGASPDEVIRTYRRPVAANDKRLSKPYFGGSVRKRKQRIKRP